MQLFSSLQNGTNFDDIKDDYSELPPNQRRKKIRQKIDQIQAQINQEMAVRYAVFSLLNPLLSFSLLVTVTTEATEAVPKVPGLEV